MCNKKKKKKKRQYIKSLAQKEFLCRHCWLGDSGLLKSIIDPDIRHQRLVCVYKVFVCLLASVSLRLIGACMSYHVAIRLSVSFLNSDRHRFWSPFSFVFMVQSRLSWFGYCFTFSFFVHRSNCIVSALLNYLHFCCGLAASGHIHFWPIATMLLLKKVWFFTNIGDHKNKYG